MSFYIEKLIVSGPTKKDSIIELSSGVNVIYGPSNTGKTYIVKCIDYMFGSKKEPIDTSLGFQYVKIIVKTNNGSITMQRKIGDKKIKINSTDENIVSGEYTTNTSDNDYRKTINFVWLSLIGVKDMHKIITNKNYAKQRLSWRKFSHMFMLTETKIISERSAILSDRDTSNTAVIASLIFLISGLDFMENNTIDSTEIKEAKKKAVKEYINKELFKISERHQELLDILNNHSSIDIETEIEKIILEISLNEKKINHYIETNQKILAELYDKNNALSECNVLLNRYDELTTQYDADLKRLNFIVDGEVNLNSSFLTHCPFCDSEVEFKKNKNYIEAAKSDHKKIKLQATDLNHASKELKQEKLTLEKEIDGLMNEKKSIEELIEKQLNPQVALMKNKLTSYKNAIEYQKEIDILNTILKQKNADIIENDKEMKRDVEFKVKDHLDYNFITELTNNIKLFLKSCNYNNLLSVTFDKSTMDIVINGKKKESNGKGYNAFFNSVMAIVLSRYMKEKAMYSPNFLLLDSPILSLKENESKKISETIKHSLFENIVDSPKDIQMIVIENEIPDIDYKDTNLIQFTKDKNIGRYGFLLEVTD